MSRVILACDGGGIRGLSTALLLADLEERVGHLSDRVDLIAGTSTGAILACALAAGIPAREIVALYEDRGPRIFARSWWWKIKTAGGITGPKYDVRQLARELRDVLGSRTMRDALCPLLVPTYDLERGKPSFWKSHHLSDHPAELADVALASSAAPTYFAPVRIWGSYYIDGGVAANNPALCAWAEARTLWPNEPITVLSIGTGGGHWGVDGRAALGWGLKDWARPITAILMDGPQEVTEYIIGRTGAYHVRVVPDVDGVSMDDASPAAIEAITRGAGAVLRSSAWHEVQALFSPRLEAA